MAEPTSDPTVNVPPEASPDSQNRMLPPTQPGKNAPGPGWDRYGVYQDDPRRKSQLLATVLSAMPGLGQVYIGYYEQGFINIVVVGSLIALLQGDLGNLTPLVGLFLAFYWLHNIVDAYRKVTFYNQSLAGLSQMEWPDEMKMPGTRGSLFGGALLILLGILFLANTMFGYSLRWIEEVWPVTLILMGGYLIYKYLQEKSQ